MSLFSRIGDRAELCSAMMRHLGIDLVQASRLTMGTMTQGMFRTCILCRNAHICAAWLAASPAAESTTYRRFCPNAEKFDGTLRYMAFCRNQPDPRAKAGAGSR
jgi:hypothetical protein